MDAPSKEWNMYRLLPTSIRAIATAALLALVVGTVSPTAFAASLNELRPGDKVRLTSGSSLMTVESIQGDKANCVWGTDLGGIGRAAIPIAALKIIGGPGWLPADVEP
jgi:hypothetical protein